MQTSLEETARHRVRLTVRVPADRFGRDLDRVYRKIAQEVRIPGFRRGRVPRKVIDAQIGREAVLEEFVHEVVPSYYSEAVQERQLAPISEPEITVDRAEEGEPLVFTAELEVRPRLTLTDYKGVRVTKPSTRVSEVEVDEFLDRLRERFAELEVVSRPAHRGDYVVADVRASVHDRDVPEATREDHLYEVGSAELVPELDRELEGRRRGEILRFNATLPDRFGELAGTEVTFQVLVKEVKAKKLPAADDEFARTASEFDTLEALRSDIREKLGALKEEEAQAEVRERVLRELASRVNVDLPDRMVDEETEHRVLHARERAERAGLRLEEVLAAQGIDELRFRADARGHAIRAIVADLVLEAVARQEGIEATEEEVAAEVARLARALGKDVKEVARTLGRSDQIGSLAGDIIRSKALDFLVAHAEIVSEDDHAGRRGGVPGEEASPSGADREVVE